MAHIDGGGIAGAWAADEVASYGVAEATDEYDGRVGRSGLPPAEIGGDDRAAHAQRRERVRGDRGDASRQPEWASGIGLLPSEGGK